MPVKHSKVLAKPDNGDTGQVQSADWNADHPLTGMLALLDALVGQSDKVMTFDGSGNPELLPKSSILSGASPAFTGVPTAPTAAPGTNTDQIATTAFAMAAIAALVTGSPALLNTLDELAQAIGDDPNFATTMATALGLKAPLASPTFTGNPIVPNQSALSNNKRAANTAYVEAAVAALSALVAAGTTASAGSVIRSVLVPYTANTSLSNMIPIDDTIPLIGEGTQIITQSFTPLSTTNKLRCTFIGEVSCALTDNAIASIFAGSVNIGAQVVTINAANSKHTMAIVGEYTPGVLTAQTITVRAGGATQNIAFNGIPGSRLLGGASQATLLIEEIKG